MGRNPFERRTAVVCGWLALAGCGAGAGAGAGTTLPAVWAPAPATRPPPPGSALRAPFDGAAVQGELELLDWWPLPWECWPAVRLADREELRVLLPADGHTASDGTAAAPGADDLTPEAVSRRAHDQVSASGWGWVSADLSGAPDRIVAALDWKVEDPGWEVVVAVSEDGGETWTGRGRVRKPHYLATVGRVTLGENGVGRLEIRLDDCADCGVPAGRYVYDTADHGRTWVRRSAPADPAAP